MALDMGAMFGKKKGKNAEVDVPRAKPAPKTVMIDRPESEGGAMRLMDKLLSFRLPVIGDRPVNTQVQVLLILLGLSFAVVIAVIALDNRLAANGALQTEIVGDTLMHTQRLAKAAPNAVAGNAGAFVELKESRDAIAANLDALANGDALRGLSASSQEIQPMLGRLADRWKVTQSAASAILANEKALLAFGELTGRINASTPRLQQLTEEIAGLKLANGASAREIAAAGQLATLTQRLGRNAGQMVSGTAANPEAALSLGRDVNQFRDLAQGLLSGSDALRLAAATDGETRSRLQEVLKVYGELQGSIGAAIGGLPSIVQSKEAELAILSDSEQLRQMATELGSLYNKEQTTRRLNFFIMGVFALAVLLSAFAIVKVLLEDTRSRAADAEMQRAQAERLEQDAKRTNEQNQAAILRLMNELQEVADGNLTVQATVSEDITGAIADSVNYTVEELRSLVSRINATAEMVNEASGKAQMIASSLQAASEQQSREIRETGESVLRMAHQINEVSARASESANVARHSLSASEDGARAVQNAITGMNGIRDQIQETAKRIKRLGESSQEIGEIVELISDITEQTNVLALNAAIQAASAGEAGRGFTVVAEEVQRLAERSAEATKQIAALIKTIQTDTQDAVAAMERSTQGVVEGTRLSDEAGRALGEIGRVSTHLAELIEDFSNTTSRQAVSAGTVAQSIQRILLVTEQTSEGTLQTAGSIRQLSELAQELKSSVSRFKVA